MRLVDYLDKGTSLGRDAPCLTMSGVTQTYGEVYDKTVLIAGRCSIVEFNQATRWRCCLPTTRWH